MGPSLPLVSRSEQDSQIESFTKEFRNQTQCGKVKEIIRKMAVFPAVPYISITGEKPSRKT